MNRIQPKPINKIWRFLLVLALILPSFSPLGATDVQAGGIPFLGLIPALVKRNKVYSSANAFIKDRAQYYDALRNTAAQQLLDRELTYGLRDNQVAAYTKVVALIEQERDAMYGFAEGEKKQAREEFIDTFQDEITNVMLSTTPATRVLGAMTQGINSSQGFLDGILTKLTGGAGGVFEDLAKIRKIADRMSIAGGLIGGKVGESIQKAGDRISGLASPTDSIEQELIKIQGELGALGDLVSGLQDRGYQPTASQTAGEVVIHLVTGEPANPAIEAIADMLVAKHAGQGNIRARARDVMLGNGAARCRAKVEQIRRVIFKMEIDPAAETEDEPNMFPTCETIDMTSLVEEVAAGEAAGGDADSEVPDGDASDQEQPAQTQDTSQPSDTENEAEETDSTASGTTTTTAEYIWVLTDTTVNLTNEPTAFYGGGANPYWFPEARFEGKSVVFSCSAGSFSVHDVDVDHGYEYRNATVGASYDSPPAQLDPGQEFELNASATHSGTVNEGGAGIGLIFQYHLNNRGVDPALSYSPWHENFDGKSSDSWTLTAPAVSGEGGEFTLSAGLWNVPPCNVLWTYRSQPNPNRSEESPPDQEPAVTSPDAEPEDPWKEAHCADLRQEVAGKVPIARGADTADLSLGIIGYMRAALGDVQINYCEGGSGAAEKGVPIRVGDCIQTGANGRGKIEFNDRDDKYNADPTTLFISRNSELCIPNFTVHRDDGKPGIIDQIRGAIRVITHGWQPGNSLGVNVSVKAAVTVASDVVLEYDPDLDLLRTYVNEGSVGVTNIQTGEGQQVSGGELLITHGESIGAVERMSNSVWNDLLEDQGLDLEETSDGLSDGFNPSQPVLILLSLGVCGGLIAGYVMLKKKKVNS